MAFIPNPGSFTSQCATLASHSPSQRYISNQPFSSSVNAIHSSLQSHVLTALLCPPLVGVGLIHNCLSIAPSAVNEKAEM